MNHATQRMFDVLKASAAVAAMLSLTACGDKAADNPAPAATSAVTPAPTAPTPAPAPSPEPAPVATDPSAKLNVYIDCFNNTNERAHKAMQRYASWVKDMKVGPTGKERVIYGTYTVGDHFLNNCNKPVLDAAAEAPALAELDAAAKAYSSTVQAWGKSLEDADKYYSRENYKDDGMAQGKAMHADFVKNYEAFEAASKAFSNGLDAENDKRQLAELTAVEKAEGRKFNYWHMSSMMAAKQLVNVIEADQFDVDTATAKLKVYEDTMGSLQGFAKQPNADMPIAYTMDSDFETLLVTAKQRIRRVRDNTPYSTGEKMNLSNSGSAWMVDGSPARLIRDYNALIESSNRLHWIASDMEKSRVAQQLRGFFLSSPPPYPSG